MKWKCKECNKPSIFKVKSAEISVRWPRKAIEIVADDICLNCLQKALKFG